MSFLFFTGLTLGPSVCQGPPTILVEANTMLASTLQCYKCIPRLVWISFYVNRIVSLPGSPGCWSLIHVLFFPVSPLAPQRPREPALLLRHHPLHHMQHHHYPHYLWFLNLELDIHFLLQTQMCQPAPNENVFRNKQTKWKSHQMSTKGCLIVASDVNAWVQ